MATLLTTKSGAYCIQYYEGKDQMTITLPLRFDMDTAKGLKKIVERLIYCRDNDIPIDKRTLVWIETAPPIIREKLAAVGLIMTPQEHTCQQLWDTFLAEKEDIKQTTFDMYETAKRRFFSFFDENRQISTLQPTDISEWKRHLRVGAGIWLKYLSCGFW